jgi:hypothetical protein
MVVLAGIVMLGSLALKKSGASFRSVWAAGALVLVLAFFADFAPTLAGPLALIIALSVGFTQGGLLDWLGNTVGGSGGRTTTAATGTATRSSAAAAPSTASIFW